VGAGSVWPQLAVANAAITAMMIRGRRIAFVVGNIAVS
jgi:hypothetical protein